MCLGAASAHVGGENHCARRVLMSPAAHVCIKCCSPYTTLLPLSHQWPNAGVQGKAQQEGCNSTAFPGQTSLLWHPSPDPASGSRQNPSLEGSRMAWEGRLTGPTAAKLSSPGLRTSSPGSGLWPWQSSSCLGTMGATIVPAGHSWVPSLGRSKGDLFK